MILLLVAKMKRNLVIKKSLFSLTLLFLADFSSAAEEVGVIAPPMSYSSSVIQMMLGLAATIVMIFVVVWLIKRVGYKGYTSTNAMKIKSTLALSPKEKLLLIEVEGEKILIGVAPGFVGLVKTLEPDSKKQTSENIAAESYSSHTSNETITNAAFSNNKIVNDLSSSFAEKLKAVLKKGEAVG
jgi:flagellar protein FliO/FliZ